MSLFRAPEKGGDRSRVWIASEVYWPEEASTGFIVTEIGEELATDWPVFVLCGKPRYDRRGEDTPDEECRRGVVIRRLRGTTLNKNNLLLRVINMVSITVSTFSAAVLGFGRGDVVIVTTNPPALPFAITVAAKLRGAKVLLMLHDVYPDVLATAGFLKRSTLIFGALALANQWLYRKVDCICTLGRDMAKLAEQRANSGVQRTFVVTVPNWSDTEAVTPEPREENRLLRSLGIADRFVVQFAGNAGRVQDVETIVAASQLLAVTDPDIHFLFVGSGQKWEWLKATASALALRNVTIVDSLPRSRQNEFLNACDIAVTAFIDGMLGLGVPSRMYGIMAAGRAQIAAIDPASEQALVIDEERIGWVVQPGDADGMASAIRRARVNDRERTEMGLRARQAAEAKYARRIALDRYGVIVRSLASPRAPRQRDLQDAATGGRGV